jgi:hypothetical protein
MHVVSFRLALVTMEIFPLKSVSQTDVQGLCKILWNWDISSCSDCSANRKCKTSITECPFYRMERLGPYFTFYKRQTSRYSLETNLSRSGALATHQDLFRLILMLQNNMETKRADLASVDGNNEVEINMALRVMLMISCSSGYSLEPDLEATTYLQPWKGEMTLTNFIDECFPKSDHPSLNDANSATTRSIKESLTALKLKRRAGLRFLPTDDLRCHLELDRKDGTVLIFHHIAFLKEHLYRSLPHSPQSTTDALKLGTLPRQLALEVIESIQKILFPLEDVKSRAFLESLTAPPNPSNSGTSTVGYTTGFDPDCSRIETLPFWKDDELDLKYYYFGRRLMELHAELENPTPRGWFERWLQRWSSARHVMLATLTGVVVAVVLGIAGLFVASYQTWITYQAWKHPFAVSG